MSPFQVLKLWQFVEPIDYGIVDHQGLLETDLDGVMKVILTQ
jgi:hypothetical protein